MIVVLTGAPGAGKGTQADLVRDRLGFRKISTGDALRRHVSLGTEIGKKAASIMESGRLVPDDVLLEILNQEIGADPKEKILLDGYPRNIEQAKALASIGGVHKVAKAINLDVDQEQLLVRLTGRRVCKQCGKSYHLAGKMPKNTDSCDACGGMIVQRPDDQPERVKVRLGVYANETRPVLSFYEGIKALVTINGNRSTEDVFDEIKKQLG